MNSHPPDGLDADRPEPEPTSIVVQPALAENTAQPSSSTQHGQSLHSPVDAPVADIRSLPVDFGRYRLLEKIDQGGMGVVYRAWDTQLTRVVALKMMQSGLLSSSEQVQRFYQEARAAAQFHHRHITPVYEVGQIGQQHYLTMAYAAGGNLAQKGGFYQRDVRSAVALVEKVARGVDYAHSKGILHRDLKPGNIVLDEQGEPLVTDFGLAKLLHQLADISTPGQLIGTTSYMSPEQAMGKTADISKGSDVWSLGVILYELLSGQRPFTGQSTQAVHYQVISQDPPSLSSVARSVPPELAAIVHRCLEKEPALRYPSAGALADDLARWLRGERPARKPKRPKSWLQRPRRAVLAVLALVLLLLAAGLGIRVGRFLIEENRARALEAEIARGGQIELFNENGSPRFSRWLAGGHRGLMTPYSPNEIALTSPQIGMLELVRNPYWPNYRFSVEIQEEDMSPGAEVGIFFDHGHRLTPLGPVENYFQLTFDRSADAQACSPALYVASYLETPDSKPSRFALPLTKKSLSNTKTAPWRKLAIEASSDTVRAYCLDEQVAVIHVVEAKEQARRSLPGWQSPDHPGRDGFRPEPPPFPFLGPPPDGPGSSLGLFVNNATAHFRHAVFEPIMATSDK
jgi:serine/threonine-protein kinase